MCQTQADAFLKCQVAKTQDDILNQVDAKRKEGLTENRKRLLPILKTVILCGRLGLSLRGHRDNGNLEPLKAVNGSEGNFRALLSFQVESGDAELSEHLKTASKKATYIFKETQNELFELCGQEILQKINLRNPCCNFLFRYCGRKKRQFTRRTTLPVSSIRFRGLRCKGAIYQFWWHRKLHCSRNFQLKRVGLLFMICFRQNHS